MAQMRRPIEIKFHVTPKEKEIIDKKKLLMGTNCTAAYCRKMALDGYVVKLDFPEMQEWTIKLSRASSNFNQIAKRVNATNRVFDADIEDMRNTINDLWNGLNALLKKLAVID